MAPTCNTSREKATSACRNQQPFVADVHPFGVVDSTMRLAREAALCGAPNGHCIVANTQHAGRGRSGARWVSSPGTGLYITVVLWPAPHHAVTSLSAAMSLAVARTCRALGVPHAQVKWPNDVIGRDGKLAGLLLEYGQHDDGESFVLLGIGLNVRMPAVEPALSATPCALPPSALCAEGAAPMAPNAALGPLLHHVDAAFGRWQQLGFAADTRAFDACHAYGGHTVTALAAGPRGEDLHGRVGPIGPDGRLALLGATHTTWLVSGSLRPAAQSWGPSP